MAVAGAIIAVAGILITEQRTKKTQRRAAAQQKIDDRTAELQESRARKIEFAEARKKRQALIAQQEAFGFQESSGTSGAIGAIGTQLAEASSFSQSVAGFARQRRQSTSNINAEISRTATIGAGFGAASNIAGSFEPSDFQRAA